MCVVKWCCSVVAIVINTSLGVWALTFNAEFKLISLAFFMPAFIGTALLCSSESSRIAVVASVLIVFLGLFKLILGATSAVFASESSRNGGGLGGLGGLVFTFLAILAFLSAGSDLVVGCSACAKHRMLSDDWGSSLELIEEYP